MTARPFPPGPSMLAAMGGLRSLGGGGNLARIPDFFTAVAARYGSIAHWRIGKQHFFLLADPVLIEDWLVFKERDFRRGRGIQRLKRFLGNGLLSSEEPLHLRQRRMIQPAFHRDRIARYGRQMVAAADVSCAAWQAGMTLDMRAEMTGLTLAIAAQTLFSTNVAGQADTIRTALMTVMENFPASISRISELLDALPMLPVTRRLRRARVALDSVIYGIIAARRGDPDAEHDDLLAMLLAARDGEAAMSDEQVRDEAMTLFTAGHETTANALSWTWYLLARHPEVAARLYAELDAVLAGRLPEPDDLPRLRFTRDVFAEAIRLYPPAWILGRRAICETTVGAYAIPAGAVVLAAQIVTHRSPRYWSDPLAFRPERWSAEPPPPRFAYFPFGGGSRRCIGENFAWMEGVLLIATIARLYAVSPADPAPVEIDPLVTLRPRTPIHVRLSARIPRPAHPAAPGRTRLGPQTGRQHPAN